MGLIPVHHFVHEQHLVERGRNFWGYNSIASVASTADTRVEAGRERGGRDVEDHGGRDRLHEAGIEVR